MTEVPKREYAAAPLFIEAFLLLCSLPFYYLAILKIDYKEKSLLDLSSSARTFGTRRKRLGSGASDLCLVLIKAMTTQKSRLPAFLGYAWTISSSCSEKAVVLQLNPGCSYFHAERNVSPVEH